MEKDALELTKKLISCPSITPEEKGCNRVLIEALGHSFTTRLINRGSTTNLWATSGHGTPFFLFAGHVDVVPPGENGWIFPPFEPTIKDGKLYGRGTQDMKTSVACFTVAATRFVSEHPECGTIGMLITSDEEGDGKDGTVFAVEQLSKEGMKPDCCIVGEPSCNSVLGDTIKNGRRGSLNGFLIVKGIQGHVAYPDKVVNPIHKVVPFLDDLVNTEWDDGTEAFPPTSFQISNIHAGTRAVNVVPGECKITFNFRFNTLHNHKQLEKFVEALCKKHHLKYQLRWQESANPFKTEGTKLSEALLAAIEKTCGITPKFSTSGGTSDARFISKWCPDVVEFGPTNQAIHKVNECIDVKQISLLVSVYYETLKNIFKKAK